MDEHKGLTRRDWFGNSLIVGASASLLAMQATGQTGARQVDLLVSGADVVAFDDPGTVISDGAIAVQGNSIVWMGKAADAAKLFAPKDTLQASGLIAGPYRHALSHRAAVPARSAPHHPPAGAALEALSDSVRKRLGTGGCVP